MKSILFASAVAAAMLCAAPALAATGQVDLSYSGDKISGGGSNENFDNINFGGAAAVNLSGNWNAQFDGHYDRITVGSDHETFSNGDAHVFYRTPAWAVGGVVSVDNVEGAGLYSAGVEGQAYLGQFQLGANFTGGELDHSGGGNFSFYNGGVSGEYFVTPNLLVSLNGSAGQFSETGEHVNLSQVGVGAEWKTQFPASFFVSYNHQQLSDHGTVKDDTWAVGARWNFGSKTLKDRENSGASFSTSSVLGLLGFL